VPGSLELFQAGGSATFSSKNCLEKTLHRYLSFDGTSKVVIDSVLALNSVIAEEMVLDLAD
jgi:hypothetical protein